MSPNARLLSALRALSPTDRQNRLMRIGDREIAMAMMHLADTERDAILSSLGPVKAGRVRDELLLQQRLNLRHADYLAAVAHLERNLAHPAAKAVLGSWIRPRGRSGPP